MQNRQAQWQETAERALELAKRQGASSAEVSASESDGFSLTVRLGEVETLEYHRDKGVDITVYFGHQQGSASTTDVSPAAIADAVSAACSIAKATGIDSCNGVADADTLAWDYPDLDLYHPWSIDVPKAIELAKTCEEQGRQYGSRIVNSEGASVSTYTGFHLYANSHGFIGHYPVSRHSYSCTLLAQSPSNPDDKQREYEYTLARQAKNLALPQWVGEEAAKKAVARLDARKLSTRQTPVVFSAHVAGGIIGHFIAAIRGSNLYREASFLLDYLHKPVFPDFMQIIEEPHLPGALGSSPFDAEGVMAKDRKLVDQGILEGYILSSYSARKLGLKTTGNAGGIHNLTVRPSVVGDLEDVLKQMGTGLLVTELMGQGVNIITGDYSRGAAGFWVENGEIQYPVHEITIAGNLRDMLMGIQGVGSDVDYRGAIRTGSILINRMTLAGE